MMLWSLEGNFLCLSVQMRNGHQHMICLFTLKLNVQQNDIDISLYVFLYAVLNSVLFLTKSNK